MKSTILIAITTLLIGFIAGCAQNPNTTGVPEPSTRHVATTGQPQSQHNAASVAGSMLSPVR